MNSTEWKGRGRLDFIVIGTPKSGTTTLFNWIREHPELFLPDGKELPFFSEDLFENGLDWYLEHHFQNADAGLLWGKVTPQYMGGIGNVMPQEIARRIHQSLPDARLIAILRNPVERAYSHYNMIVRRGHEKRSFSEAIDELTSVRGVEEARARHRETNAYVATGEYGRILGYYFELFDPRQILVLFDQDLRNSRQRVVRDVFSFLGVDADFQPASLSSDYHKGSARPKTRLLTPAFLNSLPIIPWIWSRMPNNLRRRVNFAINQWNISDHAEVLDKDSEAYRKLTAHYAKDKRVLEKLIGQSVPW